MNALTLAYHWICNKCGRLVTSCGFLLYVCDLDINPVKGPLEDLIGHKWVAGLIALLFILSFVRHQYVAKRNP